MARSVLYDKSVPKDILWKKITNCCKFAKRIPDEGGKE